MEEIGIVEPAKKLKTKKTDSIRLFYSHKIKILITRIYADALAVQTKALELHITV